MSKMNNKSALAVNITLCVSVAFGIAVLIMMAFANMLRLEIASSVINFKFVELTTGKQLIEGAGGSKCSGTPLPAIIEIVFALALIFGIILIPLQTISKRSNVIFGLIFGLLIIVCSVLLFFTKDMFISANKETFPILINQYTITALPSYYIAGSLGIVCGLGMLITPILIVK